MERRNRDQGKARYDARVAVVVKRVNQPIADGEEIVPNDEGMIAALGSANVKTMGATVVRRRVKRSPPRAREIALLAAVSAMTALGCTAAAGSDATEAGNLGQSTFLYTCTSAADASCAGAAFLSGAGPSAFPQAFAVGSRINLSVSPNANVGNPVIRPVSDEYLTPSSASSNVFIVAKEGFGGIYVESTVDSSFVDYTLLRLVAIDTLQIGDETLAPITTPAPLDVDGSLVLTALPTADAVPVAGALDFEWTVDDPTIVSMTSANPTARLTLSGLKAGTTKVTLALAGKTVSTNVTVSQ